MSVASATAPRTEIDPLAVTIVVACSFVWALNQVAVKVTNVGLQPVFQAGLRSLLGGVLVVLWGIPLFERDRTLVAGIVAGLLFAAEFVLVYIGLDFTTASRGIVFVYTMPLMMAVLAHFYLPNERLTVAKVAGLMIAFAGVVFIFADKLSLPSPQALIGDALCLGGALAWALTTLVIKRTRLAAIAPEKTLVYQLAVSAPILLAISPLYGPFVRSFSGLIAITFAYQVIVVVTISYVAWFWLLSRYLAARLSAFSFLTPLIAVVLGWGLLDEPMSPWLAAAVGLVAVGIYLVNRRPRIA